MHPGAVARVVAAVAVLALGACSTDGGSPGRTAPTPSATATPPATPTAPPSTPGPYPSYVALGDSYTAGPGVATVREDSGLCFRSDHNWPSLVAQRVGATTFRDVSCSGATTDDLVEGARPQLDAVTRRTSLVTVGVGGNDGSLFASLIRACTGGDGCGAYVRDREPAVVAATTQRVAAALGDVRRAAPRATVVLVGYLRLMPDRGTCPAVAVPAADVAAVRGVEVDLDRALAAAARQAGVPYVSLRAASRGHDACAGDQAWTNGAVVADGDGIVFHPRRDGMAAVADVVAARLPGV